MARKLKYSLATVSKRIPNYATSQVDHFVHLLDRGCKVYAWAVVPGDNGALKLINVTYHHSGVQVDISSNKLESEPIAYPEPLVVEIEDGTDDTTQRVFGDTVSLTTPRSIPIESDEETESILLRPQWTEPGSTVRDAESCIGAHSEQAGQEASSRLISDVAALKTFTTSLFESWHSLSNGVWGEPLAIGRLYDQQFRSSMLVLSFLAQLGAVAEMEIEIPQGKLILTHREQDGHLLSVGSRAANGVTFTKHLNRRQSEPIAPIRVDEQVTVIPSGLVAIRPLLEVATQAESRLARTAEITATSFKKATGISRLSQLKQTLATKAKS